jgi:hypothetical protein
LGLFSFRVRIDDIRTVEFIEKGLSILNNWWLAVGLDHISLIGSDYDVSTKFLNGHSRVIINSVFYSFAGRAQECLTHFVLSVVDEMWDGVAEHSPLLVHKSRV